VLLDHGRTVASGSPAQLKTQIGGDRIEVTVTEPGDLVAAAGLVAQFSSDEPTVDAAAQTVTAPVEADVRIVEVVRALDESGIDIRDINRRQATLDDVFLSLTGPGAESTTRIQEPAQETS
jgi:ABC-2 type transport system ATP-binding protein